MQRFFKLTFLICCFVFSKQNFSQDLRGAHIEYKWISGYTYSITATLFTDSSSTKTRNSIYIQNAGILILNSTSTSGKVRIRRFSKNVTLSGTGNYFFAINDSLRIAGIKNITNSQNFALHVENELTIDAFSATNNSPIITNYPINFNVSGSQVTYNPGLTDPDGDTLTYTLIGCTGTLPFTYYLNGASLSNSGLLTFSKDSIGIYAFSYMIEEWRKDISLNWIKISTSTYDFVLDINSGVGIKELDKKESIKIYPNPASNSINIKSYSKTHSEIEIINQLGQIVIKQKFSESVDISKLAPGYYFIRIDNSYSKFIKE